MYTPREMAGLSVLALVASDAAYESAENYAQERLINSRVSLHSYPDSAHLEDEQGVPFSLLASVPMSKTGSDHVFCGGGKRIKVRTLLAAIAIASLCARAESCGTEP